MRSWEERFVVEHGQRSVLVEAVRGLFQKTGLGPGDFARAVLYAPDLASHQAVARAAGLSAECLQPPFFGRLGNTGAAFAPMLLVAALVVADLLPSRSTSLLFLDKFSLNLNLDPGPPTMTRSVLVHHFLRGIDCMIHGFCGGLALVVDKD